MCVCVSKQLNQTLDVGQGYSIAFSQGPKHKLWTLAGLRCEHQPKKHILLLNHKAVSTTDITVSRMDTVIGLSLTGLNLTKINL